MAGENDLGGRVGLDISEFRANVNELNRQIRVVDSGFRAAAAGMDDWSQSQEGLQQRVTALNQITELQAQKVANLTEMYERVAAEQGANSRAAQELLVRLNRETEVLNQQRRELRDVTEQLGNFGAEQESVADSADEATGALGKMSGALGEIGKVTAKAAAAGIIAVGVAVAGAIGGIVKFADDSTKAFNKFQAQTGATAEEMAEFRDVAQNIYAANFGESIDDIAASMAIVKQTTGQVGDALEETTTNALMLRDTFEFEVAESVNAANSMMKAFGITSEEAYTLIAQGAQNGANKNGDLIDVLNEYSVHFAQLGLDAEQFTNVLIRGAESGAFTIDKVGDAVKEFGIRSKDESKASAEAFQALGLNAEQMFAAFAAGGPEAKKAFSTVIDRLEDMEDPLKQNQAGVALFGTMFEDLGVEAIAALGDVNGAADMTGDTLKKISEIKYNDLGSAFEGLKRQALGALKPVTDSATNMISGIVSGIQNGDWASVATAVATGIADMAGQLAEMLPDLSNIATTIIGSLAGAITAAIPTVLPAVVETVIALITTIVQVISDNGPMLITAAVQAIMTLIEGIVSALPELVKVAIELIKTLAEGIIDALPGLIDAAVEIILTLIDGILDLLPELIPVALELIITLAEGIINALPALIAKVPQIIETIVKVITQNLPKIIDAALRIIMALTKAILNNLPLIIESAIKIIAALVSGIVQAIPTLINVVPQLFSALLKAFKEIKWRDLGVNLINGIIDGVKSAAKNLANSVVDAAKDALNRTKDFLGIRSPSRLMRDEVGIQIGAGMAEGIADSAKQVNAAMRAINADISGGIPEMRTEKAGAGNVENNFNFAGLFAGAHIVIQSDDDYETIGDKVIRTLTDKVSRNGRGAGLNPA
ncbi:phage tail tape measure protein [Cohnella sp.]|uniref:phage tail tape measure protein n=1 Tax=Cohnella sp. TaxID=1883426 RepID=UPI0035684082